MNQSAIAVGLFLALSAVVYVLIEIGRQTGNRQAIKDEEGARIGLGAVEGALFGLMGLLMAFTFSGAASRFDTRRQLILQEANAIGTAWLRLDLLKPATREPLRQLFRDYLEARISVVQPLDSIESRSDREARATRIQSEIWKLAVPAAREATDVSAPVLLLPALNDMFDITSTRSAAARLHPPAVIFVMLVLLVLTSSLIAGHGMSGGKRVSWIHVVSFSVIMAGTVCLILDLEFPRIGLIRIDSSDRLLTDLRQTLK